MRKVEMDADEGGEIKAAVLLPLDDQAMQRMLTWRRASPARASRPGVGAGRSGL